MSFTAQEKLNCVKYPLGAIELGKAFMSLKPILNDHAHENRDVLGDLLQRMHAMLELNILSYRELSMWNFPADLRSRADQLTEGKNRYNQLLQYLTDAITKYTGNPDVADPVGFLVSAKAAYSGFDWSLSYADPRHDLNPNTPFDETKTIVGPHGDYFRSVYTLEEFIKYVAVALGNFIALYRTIEIMPQAANRGASFQTFFFGNIIGKAFRAWAMHADAITPADQLTISGDHAGSSGARTPDFFRALLQNELIFTTRGAGGKNFRGRNFEPGTSDNLDLNYWTEFTNPIIEANSEAEVKKMFNLGGTAGIGLYPRFLLNFSDFWRRMDAWSMTAFGFYYALPDPTIFVPVNPDGTNTQPTDPPAPASSMVPLGQFNPQAAQIAEIKAELAMTTAKADSLLASLRALEGTSL